MKFRKKLRYGRRKLPRTLETGWIPHEFPSQYVDEIKRRDRKIALMMGIPEPFTCERCGKDKPGSQTSMSSSGEEVFCVECAHYDFVPCEIMPDRETSEQTEVVDLGFRFNAPEDVEETPEVREYLDDCAEIVNVEIENKVFGYDIEPLPIDFSPGSYGDEPAGCLTVEKLMKVKAMFENNLDDVSEVTDLYMIAQDEWIFSIVAPWWARLLARLGFIDKSEWLERRGITVYDYFRIVSASLLALASLGYLTVLALAFLDWCSS